ncbi:hypothetical protein KCK33_004490 [Salmonella enterica]|nr:hypothetical protein [Salmonella enterica]
MKRGWKTGLTGNILRAQGAWGSRVELDKAAHRYTQRLAEGKMDSGIFIVGDEQNSY